MQGWYNLLHNQHSFGGIFFNIKLWKWMNNEWRCFSQIWWMGVFDSKGFLFLSLNPIVSPASYIIELYLLPWCIRNLEECSIRTERCTPEKYFVSPHIFSSRDQNAIEKSNMECMVYWFWVEKFKLCENCKLGFSHSSPLSVSSNHYPWPPPPSMNF